MSKLDKVQKYVDKSKEAGLIKLANDKGQGGPPRPQSPEWGKSARMIPSTFSSA